ncbi:MAG: CBS domain-containing protein [Alphaproteobacteria bacterium]
MSEEKSAIRVRDVMTTSLRTISATATVKDAIQDFEASHVSSLVVPRRDDADELGLVTVRDIATKVIAEGQSVDRVYVYEIMRKPVLTVDAAMNVKYAVRLLTRFGLSRAIVVDESREPLGIVTLRDMVLGHGSD